MIPTICSDLFIHLTNTLIFNPLIQNIMKKLLAIALIAVTAMTVFTACNKGKGGGEDEKAFKQKARMISMSAVYGDDLETWTYSYNQNGKVSQIVADWAGTPYATYVFTYSGNNCTVTNGATTAFTFTLGANGYIATMTAAEWDSKQFEFTYSNDGFLTQVKVNGAVATSQVITGEECVDYWTRWNGDTQAWRQKQHTYVSTIENCGAVHTEWAEDSQLKRWFYESGLVGRASRFVCATAQWADRTALAEYQYEYDTTGAIKKETKSYGEPGALEFDCAFQFTWQAIN